MAGMVTPGERTTVIMGWAAIAASEFALGRTMAPQVELASAFLEFLVLVGLGTLHAWLASLKILRGPFTAVAWALALGALMAVDGPTRPLAVMGVGLFAVGVGYAGADLEERVPWCGAPLAVAVAPFAVFGRLAMEVWYTGHGDLVATSEAVLDAAPFLVALLPAVLAGAWKDKVGLALLIPAPLLALDIKDPIGQRNGSVVLITVDTLRKDAGESMDSFQRLAEHGVVYSDATASSTWTLPALASLHTGQDVDTHRAARVGTDWLDIRPIQSDGDSLATLLALEGFDTAAVVTNPFVGYGLEDGFDHWRNLSAVAPLNPIGLGLAGRGFDLRETPASPSDGRRVVDEAFRYLDHGDGDRVFLWVHFSEPHMPYHHVPGFEELEVRDLRQGQLRPESHAAVAEAYTQEVDEVDARIETLLDGLDERGLDEAIIILTSDHGEEFWESGGVEHGHAIVDEVVQIPLVVRWAPHRDSELSRAPVSQTDLLPTLVQHFEIDTPQTVDGAPFGERSARRVVRGTLYGAELEAEVGGPSRERAIEDGGGESAPSGLEALGYVE